jgi:hypothetical protein
MDRSKEEKSPEEYPHSPLVHLSVMRPPEYNPLLPGLSLARELPLKELRKMYPQHVPQ